MYKCLFNVFIFLSKFFFINLLFSIPFLFIYFDDIINKKITIGFWITTFIPQLFTTIYFLYKYNLIKNLKDKLNIRYNKNILNYFLLGFSIPFIVICLHLALGLIDLNFNYNSNFTEKFPILVLLIFLSAFLEEIIFRYLLYEIIPKNYNLINIIIVNLGFCLFHIFNPNFNFIGLISILISGVLLSIIYLKTNNIYYPTIVHFIWNLVIGPIIGGSISGINIGGLLIMNFNDNIIFNGGSFGLEGSLISVFVLILYIFILVRYYKIDVFQKK